MRRLNRRVFLAQTGAAALLLSTGCIGDGGESTVYTVSGDEVTDDRVIHHSVELTQRDIASMDSPLSLEVTVSNEGNEFVSFGERRKALFWAVSSDGYMVIPDDSEFYEWDNDLGKWILPDGFVMTEEYQIGELEPGESVSQDLVLVFSASGDQSDPDYPEEIRFETSFSEFQGENDGSMEDGSEHSWGFTLEKEQ